MHPYAIGGKKSSIRVKVTSVILIVSIIISSLINRGIEHLANLFPNAFSDINNFLQTWSFLDLSIRNISVFVIFGILMLLFDKKLWKVRIINMLLGIPNFSGKWVGELISSFDTTEKTKVTLSIVQDWTEISVVSVFFDSVTGNKKSNSGSDSAFINPESHLGLLLKYTYVNQAQTASWEQSEHRGQNELILKEYDKQKGKYMVLEGSYFNNRGHTGNKGTISLRREDDS